MALVSYTHDCHSAASLTVLQDLGKVLAGLQIPPEDYEVFDGYLKTLGYTFKEETDNSVYKRYLCKTS